MGVGPRGIEGSPQPERSTKRSGVAEREAVGVGPRGIEGSPRPERSTKRSGVAEREAMGVGPHGIEWIQTGGFHVTRMAGSASFHVCHRVDA